MKAEENYLKKITEEKKPFWKWLKFAGFVLIFAITIEWLGALGTIWGILLFCVCFALYRIITKWESFKLALAQIETAIFNKPLQKEYWKKGEMKKTKLRIKWKKKKLSKA